MLANLSNVGGVAHGRPRVVTAENPTGEVGRGARATSGTGAAAARDLGTGWKISPSIDIASGAIVDLALVRGPGVVKHIWLTTTAHTRELVLRMFWDNAHEPAVEVPLGDFFCNGWDRFSTVTSLPVVAAPYKGFNCYWEMPFRSAARITLENLADNKVIVYYELDYEEREVPTESGYFHARWHRENPVVEAGTFDILDCPSGPGVYCGTYFAIGVSRPGWWGEGEFKFYLDADDDHPTICGTGTEDYFGGAFGFVIPEQGYTVYSAPFIGMNQVEQADGLYQSQQRFGMYRWHVVDPIAFHSRLRVTVQDLGWYPDGRYMKRQDDIAATSFWYHRDAACLASATPTLDQLQVRSLPDK